MASLGSDGFDEFTPVGGEFLILREHQGVSNCGFNPEGRPRLMHRPLEKITKQPDALD
jgi:hypothetical protein